jgi:predicted dehydrogenase
MTQFTVGIVGCGLISNAHLDAWSKTAGFTVRGVFDTRHEQAQAQASKFAVKQVYDRLDQLVDDCDIVDVCTPPQSHAAIAEMAIAAKRHLVMEKPVVTHVAEWDRLAQRIAESKTKIAVIHNIKFASSVQTAKRWVDEGAIGDVIRVQREFLTHESSDRMLVGQGHWSHSLPGGRWFETMPHELYLTHWFAGPLELSNVTAVCSPSAPVGAPADEVVVTLAGKQAISTFHFSANCRENRRTLMIQGTKGRIFVDLLSDFATLSRRGDSKMRRAFGRVFAEAGTTLLRAIPDRGRYGFEKLRKISPHAKIIGLLGKHLQGEAEEPTPLPEVDYAIRMGDRVGREIDRQVAVFRESERRS